MARLALLALGVAPGLVWGGACGGGGSGSSGPAPQAVERPGAGASPGEAALQTALPADLPERLEIEIRRRTEHGDDRVLKLTPAGARYGLSHGRARIALRYRLDEGALAAVWEVLRREGLDRLETTTRQGPAQAGGTSLRVSTGTETHAVTAMGMQAPAADDAEAYARCVAAVEELLPAGRSEVVLQLRWDASMRDRSAGLDVDVGTDLVGLHRVPPSADGGALETFELHLAVARPVELQLRQGGKDPRATTLSVRAGEERGVEVAFDATRGEAVLRPLAPTPAPSEPGPAVAPEPAREPAAPP